jgi:tetratricopeptide (TPR) repeat protein/glycosyltransferase involved in cell wall biosynthesis
MRYDLPMTTVSEQLAIAQQQHQAGHFAEAEQLCRQILEQQPDHLETLHLLGMTLHKSGNLMGAIACYQNFLNLRSDEPQVHNNLGVALRAQGKLEAAVHHYQQAIALQPNYPGVHNNLGNLLRQQGKFEEAIAHYQQALKFAPTYADPLNSIGLVLREQGKFEEAIAHYQQVLTLCPENADAYNHLGNTLQGQGRFEEAISCYQTALALRPKAHAFYSNLGAALQELGRLEEAIAAYQQALTLKPDYPDAHYNLGNALKDLDRFEACAACYHQAIALQPNYPEAFNNLGLVLYELGRLEEAIAAYQQALTLRFDYPDAHLNMALSLLRSGDLQQGFREYEYRWQVQGKNFKPPRAFAQPLWDGSNLDGKTILLHAEQGFGDTIQFIRYAALVAERGGRVVVECPVALLRLLRSIPAIAQLVPTGEELPEFQVHAPLMSLPHLLGTALIPAEIPYLAPPPSTGLKLEATGALKIGLVWAGSPDHGSDRHRSCPFTHFLKFLGLPGIQFYSLQKGARAADLSLAAGQVKDLGAQLQDFADTAAAIAQLDLVITVDTSVAHVAGALGRPVWVLLSFAPDWRWLGDAKTPGEPTRTPWYPTMRLFRQTAPGDWVGAIDAMQAALLNLLGIKAYRSEDFSTAVQHYQQALMLNPQMAEVYLNLGNTLRRQGNLTAAVAHYQQAIALTPDHPLAHNNLGVTLRQQGNWQGAIDHYQQALKLNADYPDTHYNLANVLRDQGNFTAALTQYQKAIALRPTYVGAWTNLGNTWKSVGKLQEAIVCYRRVLAIDPDHATAHNNLGHALLLSGDLQQGFAENEWRWQVQNYSLPRPPLPQPLWDGTDLAGKTILLYAEQGLGDTLQFVRYAQFVTGGTVLLECQPSLVRLLQSMEGIQQVIPRGEALPPFEVQAPLLSLPHLLGTTLETVPAAVPYLSAPETAIELEAPAHTRLKVGIVWAGSPTNRSDRYRSCTLECFSQLLNLPGIAFYSLQKGDRAGDLQQFEQAEQIQDLSQQLEDFADTAAAIAQLDLIISVDTAVAHLAGALGKPVWLLLCSDPDWRWMLDRADSPWYPTFRLFRQPDLGDWAIVFSQIREALYTTLLKGRSFAAGSSLPNPLGIGWQLGAATGWGIYGTNLALHLLQTDRFTPVLLVPPSIAAPFNPLQQKLLQPVFEHYQQIQATLAQGQRVDFPILKGLGNQFFTAPELESVSGRQNLGVIFFEDTHLSPAALERAQKFDRLITGSTWNTEVLKSYGLTEIYTVFQGIDPTIFHPAARSGRLGDRFVIFSGGKLEYRKGQDLVIRTFKAFRARHPEALLLIAWHNFWPNTMTGLEQAGHVQGLPQVDAKHRLKMTDWLVANDIPTDAFIDLGIVPNPLVGQILREADVALFPNRCEGGTNLAAMESLACGVPTILSANTGHLDLLGDHCYALRSQNPVQGISAYQGFAGWGESDIEEMLETLEAVYANRNAAQQRGAAAAQFMQDWTWERQMPRLLEMITP